MHNCSVNGTATEWSGKRSVAIRGRRRSCFAIFILPVKWVRFASTVFWRVSHSGTNENAETQRAETPKKGNKRHEGTKRKRHQAIDTLPGQAPPRGHEGKGADRGDANGREWDFHTLITSRALGEWMIGDRSSLRGTKALRHVGTKQGAITSYELRITRTGGWDATKGIVDLSATGGSIGE